MRRIFVALGIVSAALVASAAETDQFMTWNVELNDANQVLSDYLNTAAQEFVDRRNRSNAKVETAEEMAIGYYLYLFQGLHSSRVRKFIGTTPEIDRFPRENTSAWCYQRQSIYRGLSFPYIMPMARTIRVGDVYFGGDKVSHFFGFGRRYFQRYLRLRAEGVSEADAKERVIESGIAQESSLVGGLVDGVFSRGDLEANFQGFQMLLDLTNKDNPYFLNEDGAWKINGRINYATYVTPGFDESYNASHYSYFRWRKVEPMLEAQYCATPEVKEALAARFARYDAHPKSPFLEYMAKQYEATKKPKYQPLRFDELCGR